MTMRIGTGYDPVTGVHYYLDYDEMEDCVRAVRAVDPTHIIEANKYAYNNAPTSWKEGGTVARIELGLWQQLWDEGVFQDEKAKKKWLNDIDNRGWRTRPGRV